MSYVMQRYFPVTVVVEVFPPLIPPLRARIPAPQFSLSNSQYQIPTSKINSKCNLVPLILLKEGSEAKKLNGMEVRTRQSPAPRAPAHLKLELEAHTSLFPCQQLLHPP